jgi:hypothetical protein
VDRVLLALTLLALVSRLVWVLFIHPPHEYVWSDMARYHERAKALVELGIRQKRSLAWQTWGTHVLLSLPFALFGTGAAGKWAADLLWGVMSAGCVPLTYLVAKRALLPPSISKEKSPWLRSILPTVAGVIALFWYPHLALTGFYLAEMPFCFLQLATTYLFIELLEHGRFPLLAGVAGALAFAVRPQIGVFCVLVLLVWLLHRRRHRAVGPRQLVLVSVPLLLMLAFSVGRFTWHTGYCCGIAENANMNFTAARCHNIVTQAFKNEAQLARSNRRKSTRDGRRVSLPSFRRLAKKGEDHFLALRPAMKSKTIKFVGYIGDPAAHRELRRRCYQRTGVVEQARYSLVNVSLLWFFSAQWPDVSERKRRGKGGRWPSYEVLIGASELYRGAYAVVFLVPSLLGIALVLARVHRPDAHLPLLFVALQMLVSLGVAAAFFGTPRLRSPYDPFAFVLALHALDWTVARVRGRQKQ